MASALIVVLILYCTNVMAVLHPYPTRYTHLYPEHRSGIRPMREVEEISRNDYDFQIIPSDQYPVVEYDNSLESKLLEYISYPITAVATIASKALAVGKWIVVNGAMVFLGMALVIGFCAFTPFCTLVIEKPFARELRDINIPYLDKVESYFTEAYHKYKAMQS